VSQWSAPEATVDILPHPGTGVKYYFIFG
jgi:hypothetical protein